MDSFTTGDGRKLEYRRLGEGPELVCHPGGPGFSCSMLTDLGGLDGERTLILFNPRGVDGSDPAPTYELADYAADLEELRLHLGRERIDLFGHSAGGFMSMTYAAAYPDRVHELVLCGTFARFSQEAREIFERFLADREHDPRFADAVAARRQREESPPEDPEELGLLALRGLPLLFGRFGAREQAYLEHLRTAGRGYHLPALVYFNERVAPSFDLRPQLGSIRARTLVITGELDPWGAVAASELDGHIGDSRVVVLPEVGHVPWIEEPDGFRRAVSDFLS